jgi:hypothetical protein
MNLAVFLTPTSLFLKVERFLFFYLLQKQPNPGRVNGYMQWEIPKEIGKILQYAIMNAWNSV